LTNRALDEKLDRVRNALPACLKSIILLFTLAHPVHGQELLKNGDFEGGRLPPWTVNQPAGSLLALAAENSPFQTVYSGGTSSIRIKDDDADFEEPSLRQSFTAQSAILFSFDFKVPGGGASPWYVAWNGDGDTTAFFFSLGGGDGTSIDFNQQKVADLAANLWYHVEGWADAPHQQIEGKITSVAGNQSSFTGTFPFGVKSELNAVVISDGDAAPNPDVLLDNFSSRPVTLDIASNAAGQQVITWLAPGFTLQSATSLGKGATWGDVPSASGAYTNTFSGGVHFFRLTR
jgi:hypothetical protein